MSELDVTQIDQLRKIADHLRQHRQEQGISLEEIAIKTYIPLRLLQALDTGNVERLPEPVFVQGFIRRYADALGLDGWALAKTFSVTTPTVETKPPELKLPEPVATAAPVSTVRKPEEPGDVVRVAPQPPLPSSPLSPQTQSIPRAIWLGGIAALLVGVGAIAVFNRPQPVAQNTPIGNSDISPTPASSPVESPTSQLGGTTTASPSSPTSIAPTALAPSPVASPDSSVMPSAVMPVSPGTNTPLAVSIDLKNGDSWIEVIVDGKSDYQGTLKKGEQRTWEAQQKIELIAGNAGAVYVSSQNGEAKPLGDLGAVKTLTITNPNPATSLPTSRQTNPSPQPIN